MYQEKTTSSKIYTLTASIADGLNAAGILWALGSSFVLKGHGLVEQPRDIDIFVALKDWDRAVNVLNGFGKSVERVPKAPYETVNYCEYTLEGVGTGISVDLISGFSVRHSKGLFVFDLPDESAIDFMELHWEGGTAALPFMKIEDWYLMYQLLPDREKKVRLIEKHLSHRLDCAFRDAQSGSVDSKSMMLLCRLEGWLSSHLPEPVVDRLSHFCHRHSIHTFRCTVAYDGKLYSGWQTQKNLPTVQQTIEKTIAKVIGHKVDIHGSGRTDAGVHARGQVFSFMTIMPLPLKNFLTAVNRLLPKDIVLSSAEEVHSSFHARFDAEGKTYRYRIWNSEERDVFEAEYSWHVPQQLDEEVMKKAAGAMVGTHDFRSFMASGSAITDTVRTIYHVNIERKGQAIEIDFKGNGFLYNMVRIMTGLLVEVGLGKRKPTEVAEIIKAENRTRAPLTAPPQGLYLMQVEYEE